MGNGLWSRRQRATYEEIGEPLKPGCCRRRRQPTLPKQYRDIYTPFVTDVLGVEGSTNESGIGDARGMRSVVDHFTSSWSSSSCGKGLSAFFVWFPRPLVTRKEASRAPKLW